MTKEEKEIPFTQCKIPDELIMKIRDANKDYVLIPAKDIAIIALNHFLYELQHRKAKA